MKTSEKQPEQRQVENLSLKEVDMIYSLTRVGEWTRLEIARRYRISESDVRKVFDNYPQLREEVLKRPLHEALQQPPEPELIAKKARKRRSDAIYATAKERQAAYRARLQERHHAGIEQPSPTADAHAPIPPDEEFPVTVCEDPVTESGPENAET